MTTKADFNAEEWDQIAEAPALAGLMVITAQRGGTVRESLAMGKVYAKTATEHATELIGELGTLPKVEPREFSSKEDLRAQGASRITEAVRLLEAKATPEEVEEYRAFAMKIAQRAAEADKSGGVLGIGGERVTSAEQTVLAEIATALGTEPPAPDPAS